ncbi:hypothetical protein [Ornithinimicrobium cerasi]|uniref:hypothetical protein n=1 Tax=Ornithinimicrobium cerasi TaxID=2248773 RepID=UPI000EFFF80A|nr:hypothetical protein [Ornithinimicrobium cerasi]
MRSTTTVPQEGRSRPWTEQQLAGCLAREVQGCRTPAGPVLQGHDASRRCAVPGARLDLHGPLRAQVAATPSPQDLLAAVLPLLQRRDGLSPQECLDGIEAVQRLLTALAGARLHATTQLATRTGEELLRRQHVAAPDELSKTGRERWRARTKSATASQLAALTGWGRGKSRQLVAIALSPSPIRRPLDEGLDAGIATWDQVEQFWREAGRLREEHGPHIATALFATSADPRQVDAARLDPDGNVSPDPWQAKPFARSLARMLAQARGADPDADRKDRHERYRLRDALGCVDDDGSGQLVITADAASIAACADRLHRLARRARQAGDPRTLAQLRSDLARSLLLHGTLPLPATPDDRPTSDDLGDHLLDPDEVALLAAILTGTPTYHLQVLVPWDVLTGRPVLTGQDMTGDGADRASPGSQRQEREGVGAALGRESLFLTAGALRLAALSPGTTLSRILFDPADGRCIERSVARYRPDAAMRAQVLAADVHSRGIGSTTPASDSQLDHVMEYHSSGPTAELNLQVLDTGWHWAKTAKEWAAQMDPARTLTWTSMFGRLYRTRSHDYRQYLSTGTPTSDGGSCSDDPGELHPRHPAGLRPEDRRDLASFLVHAALTARATTDRVATPDDDPDSDDELIGGPHPAIWLRRTRETDARKVDGHRPGTPTPEQIITVPPATLLRAQHWTDPFVDPDDEPSAEQTTQPPEPSPTDTPPPF